MKQSEAVKLALESYYFQHGKNVDSSVVKKVSKAVKRLEDLENAKSVEKLQRFF